MSVWLHGLDIQPAHILAYHQTAKFNAKDRGCPNWDYVTVARFMADQVQDEETAKRITSFELDPAIVSLNHSYLLKKSADSYVKSARLSDNGKGVLENARQNANCPRRPSYVQEKWNLLKEHPDRRNPDIIDPMLLGKFVETPTFPSDISGQLAAAADRTFGKSSSNSPEGDAS